MKSILFNTEMVRAILDGRKTMTRRVMKPQPESFGKAYIYRGAICIKSALPRYSPYRTGDILYVRETWCNYGELNDNDQVIDGTEEYYYRADGENPTPFNCFLVGDEYRDYPVWRPSIHMPKEAARIFLRITDVRVERLQDITEMDAIQEGFEPVICTHPCGYPCTDYMNTGYLEPAIPSFIDTWEKTIKKSDHAMYGWNANPWVFVISFERINKEDAK